MKIVIIGLSITSSWGNGHATTYRSLVAGLAQFGQDVLFLEQDRPWYAAHRDMAHPPFCQTVLYANAADLAAHADAVAAADLVVVGSYVADGPAVCQMVLETARGVRAFYDIDTPVTLAALAQNRCDYITPELIGGFDLYLSFTGGPTLRVIERRFGARMARALYCSADPDLNAPDPAITPSWDLGYLGTYSLDRQPTLDHLLCTPARLWPEGRFNVTGPQYPSTLHWPANVDRSEHSAPSEHRAFYASQRFTLNITRADMIRAGYSPSVRLFEAAACGTPIISDWWPGLDTLFRPGVEIVVARRAEDVLAALQTTPEHTRLAMADRARSRVLQHHTGRHRAAELMGYVRDVHR